MGLDREFDFEKKCTSDLSPNTVLPCRKFSDVQKRRVNGKPPRRDDLLAAREGFKEIRFHRYRSSSCKTASRHGDVEGEFVLKRGSIYQSSREIIKMKKMGIDEGRRKIEVSRDSDHTISFSIVDSLCSSDEEKTQKRSSRLSLNSNLNLPSIETSCVEPYLSDNFFEICPNLEMKEKQPFGSVRRDSAENQACISEQAVGHTNDESDLRGKDTAYKSHSVHVALPCSPSPSENDCSSRVSSKFSARTDLAENSTSGNERNIGPSNDDNDLLEKDTILTFHKSHSVKVQMPNSPSPSESDCSSRGSSKFRFSPIRKMFDPFMKSKSLRSPLVYTAEPGDVKTTGMANIRKNQILRRSLLHDFSYTSGKSDTDSHHSSAACSPVHLHGCLKLGYKHEVPHFEFSLDCPEEVLIAKTWKAKNAFNWVYTFHSISNRKKSNASGWGFVDGSKGSSVVGQMQVRCYLCSELKDGVFYNDSMVTEFVLYDIAHARHGVSTQDSQDIVESLNDSKEGSVYETCKLDNGSEAMKLKHRLKHALDNGNVNCSNLCPLPAAVLHSDLEIAAIVIQLPIAKRESLKYKRGSMSSDTVHLNILDHSMFEQRRNGFTDKESPEMLKVVIPTGNHGLPIDEHDSPSPLLNRWRSGGGCDCGGWDMACPLSVLGSPSIDCSEDKPLVDNQRPLELFVQGTKQKLPALTMRVVEEGQYAVDFHAQLSTLQAFSICVAILHGAEASQTTGEERSKQLPHCNSLKILIEEEVQFLIEAVTEDEKMKKKKVPKKIEDIKQPYLLNPPFSPIARV